MRVLIVPELYRPTEASANATLNDAITWVERWLQLDENVHVYWLLPHRGTANYEREYVLADRDRVTLVEADPLMCQTPHERLFTESGYSESQLRALKRRVYDNLEYVDVVIDQLRSGRWDLYKWLLTLQGHRPGEPTPFAVIANVHDLMLPFKYPTDGNRIDYHRKLEVVEAVFSDNIWFKAEIDAEGMPLFASEFLPLSTVDEAIDEAVMTESPIDLSRFEEAYADEPRWLHVAGSCWEKKHPELVMEIAETLYDRFGVRTLMTSMEQIPENYTEKPWVEAHPGASRATYEAMLRKGDIAICATEYDTLARTWFEQAASGQVLVLRDEPWLGETVPSGHPLVAPVDELEEMAAWVVENWGAAVEANRDLVAHLRRVRNPDDSGRKTYADLARHAEFRRTQYASLFERGDDPIRTKLIRAISRADSETLNLRELNRRGTEFTSGGCPFLDAEGCTLTDLVFALRSAGYVDTGTAGVPVFRAKDAPVVAVPES